MSVISGKSSPSGGYTTVSKWIDEKGSSKNETLNGTIDLFADNVGKYILPSYSVRSAKSESADVITTCLQIQLDDPINVQKFRSLKRKTSFSIEELPEIHAKMEQYIAKAEEDFRKLRFEFVVQCFEHVVKENDLIDLKISDMEKQL